MNDKYKTKSEIIASLKEAIVIDSHPSVSEGLIYVRFNDLPHVEYRIKFSMLEFECLIEDEKLNVFEIDEHEQIVDVGELAMECKPSMIFYCLRFGMQFELTHMVNQTVKELWEQIEAMKAYLDDSLTVLQGIRKQHEDSTALSLIDARIFVINSIKSNGWEVKKDLLNLNIQS